VVVRLNDVAPEGGVTRVTYGVLNLTHRDNHATPAPLEPGRTYRVRVQLNDAGYRFAAGHRVRIAISTAYWPIVWPAPTPATLTVTTGVSTLTLPVRRPRPEDADVRFDPPERPATMRYRVLQPGAVRRTISQDVGTGTQTIEVLRDDGRGVIEEIGVETAFCKELTYRVAPNDPTAARAEARHDIVHRHAAGGDWNTRIRTHAAIACT